VENSSDFLVEKMFKQSRRKQILSLVQPFISPQTEVLDVGCGDAWLLHGLKAKRRVGADIQRHRRLSVQGIEFYQVSVYSLPFPSESFDVVVLNSMVEHSLTLSSSIQWLST